MERCATFHFFISPRLDLGTPYKTPNQWLTPSPLVNFYFFAYQTYVRHDLIEQNTYTIMNYLAESHKYSLQNAEVAQPGRASDS